MGGLKQNRKKETITSILDIMIFVCILILLIIIVGGGFSFSIGGSEIQAYTTKNPSLALIILLLIRKTINREKSICESWLIKTVDNVIKTCNFQRLSPSFILSIFIGSYVIIISIIAIMKHISYNTTAYDLGIFDQLLWNVLHGNGLYSSMLGHHFFGEHVSPILFLLAPMYWIYAGPKILLIFQTMALASGAIPVYWVAEKKLQSRRLALFFSCLYLCYPPLRAINLFDFHPVTLTIPLLLFAFFYLDQKKYLLFGGFLTLALFCKEEIATIVLILGIYIAFVQKKKKLGLLLSLVGIGIFILNIWVIIPYYRQAPFGFIHRYGYLGDSVPEILKTLAFHPIYVLKHVFITKKKTYFLEIFGPLGFSSFFSPSHAFLMLPTFLQNILSDFPPQYSSEYHYSSALIPFVFISAICGVQNLFIKIERKQGIKLNWNKPQLMWRFSVILCFFSLFFFGKSPIYQLRNYYAHITNHTRITNTFIGIIPDPVSVSAQATLVPHLSGREAIYQFPVINDAEYIFLDTTAMIFPLSEEEYPGKVLEVFQTGYGVIEAEDNLILFKKGYNSSKNESVLSQLRKR